MLAANLIDGVVHYLREHRPLERAVLSLGDSSYAMAPVLVLAAAGHQEFAWAHWPIYVLALAAQIAIDALTALARLCLHFDVRLSLRGVVALPSVIDAVLTVPALGVVAISSSPRRPRPSSRRRCCSIAPGFTSERSRRLAERRRAAENARRAVFDERVRIARELHDVVAHHVSVMGVQAGAARVVLERDPEKAAQALASIEASSRQAVARAAPPARASCARPATPEDLAPQPGLDQLDKLAAAMSDSQLTVVVQVEGERRALAPTVDVSAYRIVQEALTNTLKHAARLARRRPPALPARRARASRSSTTAAARAPPRRRPAATGSSACASASSLHGGELTTGPVAGGGFAVHATLPIAEGAP